MGRLRTPPPQGTTNLMTRCFEAVGKRLETVPDPSQVRPRCGVPSSATLKLDCGGHHSGAAAAQQVHTTRVSQVVAPACPQVHYHLPKSEAHPDGLHVRVRGLARVGAAHPPGSLTTGGTHSLCGAVCCPGRRCGASTRTFWPSSRRASRTRPRASAPTTTSAGRCGPLTHRERAPTVLWHGTGSGHLLPLGQDALGHQHVPACGPTGGQAGEPGGVDPTCAAAHAPRPAPPPPCPQVFNSLNVLELKSLEEPRYLLQQFVRHPLACLTLAKYALANTGEAPWSWGAAGSKGAPPGSGADEEQVLSWGKEVAVGACGMRACLCRRRGAAAHPGPRAAPLHRHGVLRVVHRAGGAHSAHQRRHGARGVRPLVVCAASRSACRSGSAGARVRCQSRSGRAALGSRSGRRGGLFPQPFMCPQHDRHSGGAAGPAEGAGDSGERG